MSGVLDSGRRRPVGSVLLLLGGAAVLVALFVRGRGYYLEPLADQALDPRHATLRSSGPTGVALGVAAVALIATNLGYLLRRRLVGASWLGSLRGWMNAHVVSGLLAGGCVALHAALDVRSAPGAVASGALAIVIVTGVVGRWVHAQIPRTREGRELSLDEARRRFEELRDELASLGLPPLQSGPVEPLPGRSKLRALARLLLGDAAARAEHRRYRALVGERVTDRAALARILPPLDRLLREAQALVRLGEVSALMASWRFLHRWLALVMVGTAACHVALALRYAELRWQEWLHWHEWLP